MDVIYTLRSHWVRHVREGLGSGAMCSQQVGHVREGVGTRGLAFTFVKEWSRSRKPRLVRHHVRGMCYVIAKRIFGRSRDVLRKRKAHAAFAKDNDWEDLYVEISGFLLTFHLRKFGADFGAIFKGHFTHLLSVSVLTHV